MPPFAERDLITIPRRFLFLLGGVLVLAGASCGRNRVPTLPPGAADRDTGPGSGTAKTGTDAAEPAVASAPSLEIRVEPSVIQTGGSALLSWDSRDADEVRIDQGIGVVDPAGRIKLFPEETTSYRVSAMGPGGKVERLVTIQVSADGDGLIGQQDLLPPPQDEVPLKVEPVFFSFDSDGLDAQNLATLEANGRWFSEPENAEARFVLEGHCDERGTDEYNLALADKRAQVVRQFLVDAGIDPDRMTTIALGEERPFDTGHTEEAWALNRRVHFVLIQDQE